MHSKETTDYGDYEIGSATYYHGTSLGLWEKIQSTGYLKAPVYLTTSPKVAQWFASDRLRFAPTGMRTNTIVLELDLAGYKVVPDPDPESVYPRTMFTGKNFIARENIPLNTVLSVSKGELVVCQTNKRQPRSRSDKVYITFGGIR